MKTSFFTVYQIKEIALLTKKLYCLPKIFVKRFLLVGQSGVYKFHSLCIALKHELARVSAGPSPGRSGRARTQTRRKMACLAPIDAWRVPVSGTCVQTDNFSRRRAKAPPFGRFKVARFRARVLVADCHALPDRQLSLG